jgi:hypothetical protein
MVYGFTVMICDLSMDKERYLSVVCGSLSPYAEEKNLWQA